MTELARHLREVEEPQTGEVFEFVTKSQRLRQRIEKLAERHSGVPEEMKKIAVAVTVDTFSLSNKGLIREAFRLDAIDNPELEKTGAGMFIAVEGHGAEGSLIARYKQLRARLTEDKIYTKAQASNFALGEMRASVGRRIARGHFAQELGYNITPYEKVVRDPRFKRANSLAEEAMNTGKSQ